MKDSNKLQQIQQKAIAIGKDAETHKDKLRDLTRFSHMKKIG